MAGVSYTARIDDADAQRALARLIDAGGDTEPMMDEIGGMLVASTVQRFEQGVAPDGTPWKESIRAREQGGQTLVDSARLKQSITHRPAPGQVEVGTNVIYAAIQQFGGTITAKSARALVFRIPGAGWATVSSVTIPARPFLGLSDEDAAEIPRIVVDHLRDAVGGRV